MKLAAVAALVVAASAPCTATAAPSAALADTLSFEFADSSGSPAGWKATFPPVRWDPVGPHRGRGAARIGRDSASAGEFTAFSRSLPVDFGGDTVELSGWIRTENVRGFAGLWLREDSRVGTVQFDNMQRRGLSGTSPWTEYRIRLPLDRRARWILFGGLLETTGAAWFDDLRLFVDGTPVEDALRIERPVPLAERDHEFDGGSRTSARALLAARVENLALLAKVWGFVKYHHPRVASGALNWDYELFRILPDVARAPSRAEAARAMVRWLDRVGPPPACRPCAEPPRAVALPPSIEWIHDRDRLTSGLASRLERIHRDRSAAPKQYYVAPGEVGNPDFANEGDDSRQDVPDAGYRLLALFRFWNIIEYWFPYRDLIREDWDGVLREFIPRTLRAGDRDEYRLAMIDLVARVHDGHANVWNALEVRPPRGGCRLPVTARPVGDRFVVAAYADSVRGRASGLLVGDEIVALDGARTDSLARAWSPHHGASNEAARRRDIARSLTQGPCGPCRVSVDRGRGTLEVAAVRDSSRTMDPRAGVYHDLPGEAFRLLAEDVAYLKLSQVVAADIDSYLERAAGTRCLVIDIRSYPRQFVVFSLGQHLIDRPTPFARFTKCDFANPGAFVWADSVFLNPKPPRYGGRVVILVDETSQSQAEYTTMAFRAAPGALVVGSTTAGADGNYSSIPLPGGLRPWITGIGVFYPDAKPTQQIGIVPDLVVHPTIQGIREGRDEVLEAALEAALGRQVRFPVQP